MTAPHLGALVTPFVDGELSAARAAAVQAHVAVCAECRRAVTLEQASRRRTHDSVRGMQASAELTARLLAMPAGPPGPAAVELGRTRRTPFVLGGGVAVVGLFVLSLLVLGTPRTSQSPGSMLAAVNAAPGSATAVDATPVSDVEALDGAASAAWSVPSGLAVDRIDLMGQQDSQALHMTLDTTLGEVRVLERPGTLDEEAAASLGSVSEVAGHVVYRVEGWYLLESGSCVVAVLGESDEAAETVIAGLPEPHGVFDRIAQGWNVLVD